MNGTCAMVRMTGVAALAGGLVWCGSAAAEGYPPGGPTTGGTTGLTTGGTTGLTTGGTTGSFTGGGGGAVEGTTGGTQGGGLPFTGSDLGTQLVLGLGVLAAGTAVVVGARRRGSTGGQAG